MEIKRNFALADGSHWGANTENYINAYIRHVEFINASLLQMVDAIMIKSEKPIIIIQADHGPGSELDWDEASNTSFDESLSVLNVLYFYDQDYGQLYNTITPVNSFRVIFNQFFDADFELLEDESYFPLGDIHIFFIVRVVWVNKAYRVNMG